MTSIQNIVIKDKNNTNIGLLRKSLASNVRINVKDEDFKHVWDLFCLNASRLMAHERSIIVNAIMSACINRCYIYKGDLYTMSTVILPIGSESGYSSLNDVYYVISPTSSRGNNRIIMQVDNHIGNAHRYKVDINHMVSQLIHVEDDNHCHTNTIAIVTDGITWLTHEVIVSKEAVSFNIIPKGASIINSQDKLAILMEHIIYVLM